jgi:hypothetical protein
MQNIGQAEKQCAVQGIRSRNSAHISSILRRKCGIISKIMVWTSGLLVVAWALYRLGIAVLTAFLANRKGFDGRKWFFVGLAMSFYAIPIIFIAPARFKELGWGGMFRLWGASLLRLMPWRGAETIES